MRHKLKNLIHRLRKAGVAAAGSVEKAIGSAIGAASTADASSIYALLGSALEESKEIGGPNLDRIYIANRYTIHIQSAAEDWLLWKQRLPISELVEFVKKTQESSDPPLQTYYEPGVRLVRENASPDARIWVDAEKKPNRVPTRCTPVASLCVVQGKHKGESFLVTAGGRIGRFEEAQDGQDDIVLSDPSISDVHAQFLVEGAQLVIKDLGSSNGTRVGGQDVPAGGASLDVGGILQVGDVVFRCDRPRSFAPYLLIVRGPLSLQGTSSRLDLSGGSMTIGRRDGDVGAGFINLHPDPATAPEHVQIRVQDETTYVEDLTDSSWGRPLKIGDTFPGPSEQALTEGDILQVGDVKLLYREG